MKGEGWAEEGEKLVRAAEKKLKGNFLGNLLTPKAERVEAALDLYRQALDHYKLAKNWQRCRAINADCATLCLEANELREAADFSAEAGDCAVKAGEKLAAVECFKKAAEGHKRAGAFDAAAHSLRKIGDFYEREEEPGLAVTFLREAAELYSLAKYHTTDATKLQVKAADLLAQMFDQPTRLKEAIEAYELVCDGYLANNLLRFHAKDLFVKAVVVFLLLEDDIGARRSLERYCDRDPSLANAFERKFLEAAIDAYARRSAEEFDEACAQLMKRSTLEDVLRRLLTRVKLALAAQGRAGDEDPL